MKKQKKHSLLFALLICFLVYVVLSWFVPTGSVGQSGFTQGSTAPVGLFGLLYYPAFTLGIFTQYAFVVLAIGALYGVMAKTGVYGKLVEKVAKRYDKNEYLFLTIVVCVLTIFSSVIGIPYIAYIFIPFFIAVLSVLGFKKVTCVAATFGSLLVGEIGSTFGLYVSGYATSLFGLKISNIIYFKLGLLVVALILFILLIREKNELKDKHAVKEVVTAKKGKSKKAKEEEVVVPEVKSEPVLFLENEVRSNKSSLSLVILFIVTIVFAVIAMYDFSLIFGISFFNDLHQQIINVGINGYPIFKNILGVNGALGTWDSYELVAILLIASSLIAWVYNLKMADFVDGMVEGAKKMLKPAFYITFANIIFTFMLMHMEGGTIVSYAVNKLTVGSDELNIFTGVGSGLIGSFFFNNFNYLLNEIGAVFSVNAADMNYALLAFIVQGIFGVMMLILPTSLILVTGLSMMDVTLKEWYNYIKKYFIQLLVIVIIVGFLALLVI